MKSETGGCRGRHSEMQAISMGEGNRDGIDTEGSGGLWLELCLTPAPEDMLKS